MRAWILMTTLAATFGLATAATAQSPCCAADENGVACNADGDPTDANGCDDFGHDTCVAGGESAGCVCVAGVCASSAAIPPTPDTLVVEMASEGAGACTAAAVQGCGDNTHPVE